MPTPADAELIAALEAARGMVARVLHNHRALVDAVRLGEPLAAHDVLALEAQLRADERDLWRFGVRVQQLRAGQAVH